MDHVRKKTRSKIMASVRSRGNTTTELPLQRMLNQAGFKGFRKHWPIAGKPDFAWPRQKVALFVDGCFWHGCRCKYLPRTNRAFWRKKIENNKRRDARINRKLRALEWRVLRVWEHSLKSEADRKRILLKLEKTFAIMSSDASC